jgi:hypothetical protein
MLLEGDVGRAEAPTSLACRLQRADDLFIKLHVLTRQTFPAYERFELGGQLRRAAYSVRIALTLVMCTVAGVVMVIVVRHFN